MTEGDKGDIRCRGWWAASGDFACFGLEGEKLRIDLLSWRRLLLFEDKYSMFPGLVYYPR